MSNGVEKKDSVLESISKIQKLPEKTRSHVLSAEYLQRKVQNKVETLKKAYGIFVDTFPGNASLRETITRKHVEQLNAPLESFERKIKEQKTVLEEDARSIVAELTAKMENLTRIWGEHKLLRSAPSNIRRENGGASLGVRG